jgi:CysZ protein
MPDAKTHFAVFADIITGTGYIWRGIKLFYGMPRYWKYNILPLLLIAILYCGGIYLLFWQLLPWAYRLLPSPENCGSVVKYFICPLQILTAISLTVGGLLFLLLVLTALYEIVSAPFLESLVIRIEHDQFAINHAEPAWRETLSFTVQTFYFSMSTLFLGLILTAAGWLIPVAGSLIMILFIGYRFALSSLFCCAFNRHLDIRSLRKTASKRLAMMYGFGVLAYLLLLLPFTIIFLLPCFTIGATLMFNEELTPKP